MYVNFRLQLYMFPLFHVRWSCEYLCYVVSACVLVCICYYRSHPVYCYYRSRPVCLFALCLFGPCVIYTVYIYIHVFVLGFVPVMFMTYAIFGREINKFLRLSLIIIQSDTNIHRVKYCSQSKLGFMKSKNTFRLNVMMCIISDVVWCFAMSVEKEQCPWLHDDHSGNIVQISKGSIVQ